MSARGSESWWFANWGQPCDGPRSTVVMDGLTLTCDTRAVGAFEAWEVVRARHGYDLRKADTGIGNCRHIGNDPNRPWSTHAWWAALDANWQTNPQRKPLTTDFPQPMIDDLLALTTTGGLPVFRWGAVFSTPDAMHWEVFCTPSELAGGILDPNGEDDVPTPQEWDALVAEVKAIRKAVYAGGDSVNATPLDKYIDSRLDAQDAKLDAILAELRKP